jgi:hypothetical protein
MPQWVEPADLQGCEHEAVEVINDTNGSAKGRKENLYENSEPKFCV